MPMLGPGVSPRDSMLVLGVEKGVGYTKIVLTAKLQQALSILIRLPGAKLPKTCRPRIMVSTHSGVEVAEDGLTKTLFQGADQ